MIVKLSRKDIKMLESSVKNDVSKSALEEYLSAHKKAETAWKVFRDSLVLSEGSSEDSASKKVKDEKVRKFKAGDKVRVLSTAGDVATAAVATAAGLSVGDITEVVAYKGDSPKEWDSNSKRQVIVKGLNYFAESALELVVEEEKSPNELRAEIIQRAKEFVKNMETTKLSPMTNPYRYNVKVDFIVNTDKRAVVALLKSISSNKVVAKGVAKCHSDDVFNKHIGKAIALGRALGKDVSEFENAVQPTKAVLGQVIVWKLHEETVYRIDDKTGNYFNFTDVKTNEKYCDYEYCEIEKHTNVVDDTNAQY